MTTLRAVQADPNPANFAFRPDGTVVLYPMATARRRAERLMVQLAGEPDEAVSAAALQYINRLSDFLFVAGRYVNELGKRDVLWVPGQNR